jgi:cobyrinic acid a,c-diamide synthase
MMNPHFFNKGFIVSALSSDSGKTLITAALINLLQKKGYKIGSFKVGPDYIDPMFHQKITQDICFNIDLWGMPQTRVHATVRYLLDHNDWVVGEGVMGLFDGSQSVGFCTADIATLMNLPIILIVNCHRLAETIFPIIQGMVNSQKQFKVAGIILNQVGSKRHAEILSKSLQKIEVPILGYLPRLNDLVLHHRHLGLHQPIDIQHFQEKFDLISNLVAQYLDIDRLINIIEKNSAVKNPSPQPLSFPKISLPVLGQRIAVAFDKAFSFVYPVLLESWRLAGAEIFLFSPLGHQQPPSHVDAVYLPGGYPELYLKEISQNRGFLNALKNLSDDSSTVIYGECGGFMVMGQNIEDESGNLWPMAGLFDLTTSMQHKKLVLGYRRVQTLQKTILGPAGSHYRGHEFHYAKLTSVSSDQQLYRVLDNQAGQLGLAGLQRKKTIGSFIHLIDKE